MAGDSMTGKQAMGFPLARCRQGDKRSGAQASEAAKPVRDDESGGEAALKQHRSSGTPAGRSKAVAVTGSCSSKQLNNRVKLTSSVVKL